MSAGLLRSTQSLFAGLLALGRTRLELFSIELQQELARQALALLGAMVLIVLATLAAAFGAVALLIAAGEADRLAAAVAVSAAFAVLAVVAALALRRAARARPRAFEGSIAELERDYEALKP